MPEGRNRPSRSADAVRERNRKSRQRRYEAQGAQFVCWFCPTSLPTERGRNTHMTVLHRRDGLGRSA